ncbi:hypothetical protein GOM49_11795 [Clostridium bovifaecis]|uniref:MurNAc-LAA domain-containing protein n=1 Tax=Clostridium bovifaecis TaxID=2184719 RepID=A0A6I6EZL2_9CLOT|nr:hypothetical protein GOM49_11795 [Clostridium bovifaecis]
MKIYIDPGHGGNDSGAVGNGLVEKNLNLDISLKEKALFEKLGHTVRMSRTADKSVPLSTRTDEANFWGADIFISNHINSGGGVGVEVWHSIYGGKGKEYAARVERSLSEIFKSRGLKSREGRGGDYLYVIRTAKMPAILIEFGFIDSIEDTSKLKQEDIRQKCAEAVVYGVLGQNLPKVSNSPRVEIESPVLKRLVKYTAPMMKGEDIKLIQKRLNELGFHKGYIDGIYGRNTEAAVRAFQKAKALTVDGIVGEKTWNSLMNSASKPKSELKRLLRYTIPMMSGEDVKIVQQKLNQLGFNAGVADGIYGKNTEAAVKRFQGAKGIAVDGIVGQSTWKVLF